jgi:hypothetical protein
LLPDFPEHLLQHVAHRRGQFVKGVDWHGAQRPGLVPVLEVGNVHHALVAVAVRVCPRVAVQAQLALDGGHGLVVADDQLGDAAVGQPLELVVDLAHALAVQLQPSQLAARCMLSA